MRACDVQAVLYDWDRQGRYVFTKGDLALLLNDPSENALNETLRRSCRQGTLVHAARGVYVNARSAHVGPVTIEYVARALRRGHYVFESLESAASQWGDISQVPLGRITCMTTGRKGTYRTPYGVIELVHTAAAFADIAAHLVERPGHAIPIASREYTLAALRRTGRSRELLEEGACDAEW